jgi:hypothetical protein|tara:strand:- start:242 stop:424 length:183 start_codon:yes stop_codon:yes gene_type:complete
VVVEVEQGIQLVRVMVVLAVVLLETSPIPNTVLLVRQTRVVERLRGTTALAQTVLLAVRE